MIEVMPNTNTALEISSLAKSYGARPVFRHVDLCLNAGAAFALLGVNGAGKTTLLKCVLDFCSADNGSIRLFGTDHRNPQARTRLAYVPERFIPPHYLTGEEFLRFELEMFGQVFDREKALRMLQELQLEQDALDKPVRHLSKGMTQKIGLAACFLARRDMCILDEPMSGLDPASRVAVKGVLARLRDEGRTLFFTSHVLADVEELCSSMAILHDGGIKFHGPPDVLCRQYSETLLERAFMRCIRGQ